MMDGKPLDASEERLLQQVNSEWGRRNGIDLDPDEPKKWNGELDFGVEPEAEAPPEGPAPVREHHEGEAFGTYDYSVLDPNEPEKF
jgi:hypothetical protein